MTSNNAPIRKIVLILRSSTDIARHLPAASTLCRVASVSISENLLHERAIRPMCVKNLKYAPRGFCGPGSPLPHSLRDLLAALARFPVGDEFSRLISSALSTGDLLASRSCASFSARERMRYCYRKEQTTRTSETGTSAR